MELIKLQTEIAEENGFNTWDQMIDCFCTTDPDNNFEYRDNCWILQIEKLNTLKI